MIRIAEEDISVLPDYGTVSIAFEVKSVFDVQVVDAGLGGILLTERPVARPYLKDYDRNNGEGPTRWAKRWDIRNWVIVSAFDGNRRVGGCAVAFDTEGLITLEGRKDVAAVWDLRIQPDVRRNAIGRQLFRAAVQCATDRGCRLLKVETQNINVPACRFYAKQGCVLGALNRFAYRDFPDETELTWYKELP